MLPSSRWEETGSRSGEGSDLSHRLAELRNQLQNSALYRPGHGKRREHERHERHDRERERRRPERHSDRREFDRHGGNGASRVHGSRRHRSRRSESHREGRHRRRKPAFTLQEISDMARGDATSSGRHSRRDAWRWDSSWADKKTNSVHTVEDNNLPALQRHARWNRSQRHFRASRSRSRRYPKQDDETEEREEFRNKDDRNRGYGYGYGRGQESQLPPPQPEAALDHQEELDQEELDQEEQELEEEDQEEEEEYEEDELADDLRSDGPEHHREERRLLQERLKQAQQELEHFRQQELQETGQVEVIGSGQSMSPRTPMEEIPDFSLDEDDEADAEGEDEVEGSLVDEGDEVAHVDPYELADSDDGELFAALERAAKEQEAGGDAKDAEVFEAPTAEGTERAAPDLGLLREKLAEVKPKILAALGPKTEAQDVPKAPEQPVDAPKPATTPAVVVSQAPAPKEVARPHSQSAPHVQNQTTKRPVAKPAERNGATPTATPSAPSRAKKPRVVNDSALVAGWHALLTRTRRHPDFPAEYTSCFGNEGKNWLKASRLKGRFVLGIDCEMVYAKDDKDALARVSVVSCSGVIYDAHVQKKAEDVLDYRTRISGVEAHHLLPENGALPFDQVQREVLDLISVETILVGHSLHKDLRALKIQHAKIVDTALIFAVEGGSHRRRHKLNSLVTLMRRQVPTLQPVRPGAHDPRQDAQWALQLALYEASIHPSTTKPLKLLSFPKTIFLSEIPKGTTSKELGAFFAHGACAEVNFHLQPETGSWLGTTTVTFGSQAERDKAFNDLPRFVRVYVGPLRDWAGRTDLAKMQAQLKEHFLKFGRVRSCRVMCPRAFPGQSALPFGLLECHPTAARVVLTNRQAQSFPGHRSLFKVSLAEAEANETRCAVPLSKHGSFLARLG